VIGIGAELRRLGALDRACMGDTLRQPLGSRRARKPRNVVGRSERQRLCAQGGLPAPRVTKLDPTRRKRFRTMWPVLATNRRPSRWVGDRQPLKKHRKVFD